MKILNKLKVFFTNQYSATNTAEVAVKEILTRYGNELPEEKQIDNHLRKGIILANSGSWEEASVIFSDIQAKYPDYDVPYLWLAMYIEQKEGAALAVNALQESVELCRRKHNLLYKAGELTLLKLGDVFEANYFFAQSISTMTVRPDMHKHDFDIQQPFLYLKAMFDAFRDDEGVRLINSITGGTITNLNKAMIGSINKITHSDVNVSNMRQISFQLLGIRAFLAKKFRS